MKRKVALIICAIFLTMSVACQPTPEEDYVVQRDGAVIEQKLKATIPVPAETPEAVKQDENASEQASDKTEAPKEEAEKESEEEVSPELAAYRAAVEAYKATLPEHWSDYLETEYIKMPIEADIIVNNVDGFPVYKVRRTDFDTAKLEAIANKIMPNVTGIREGTMALPEEYADAIRSLNERGMTEFAEAMFNEGKRAKEGSYTDATSISFADRPSGHNYVVRLADNTQGQIYIISGSRAEIKTRLNSIIHVADDGMRMYDGSYVGEGDVYLDPPITEEQAKEILDSFLDEMDLTAFCVETVKPARCFSALYREEVNQGWKFGLARSYGYYAMDTFGAGCNGGMLDLDPPESFNKPWYPETLDIYVSENGVEYVQWNSPLEVMECVNPCVELLDFAQIQENLKKLLYAGIADINITVFQPRVSKMVLTVAPQQIQGDAQHAYLMPIWIAFVDWYYLDEDKPDPQVIGINALDGSRAVLVS